MTLPLTDLPLAVLIAPAAVQGTLLVWDETFYHRKRGLPRWERIGHPLDTVTILLCLFWARLAPWTEPALIVYGVLALGSCLFVTKDEFVHARLCCPMEHWLHSALFLVHPVALAGAAALWHARSHGGDAVTSLTLSAHGAAAAIGLSPGVAAFALSAQLAAALGLLLYQSIYWNLLYVEQTAV